LRPPLWNRRAFEAADATALTVWTSDGGDLPALLLHGFTASALTWARAGRSLGHCRRLVLPDFRGHGDSGRSERGFTLDLLTGDTLGLIDGLGLNRFALLGHSMGAEIAARIAVELPDAVSALVLEDPPMRPVPPAPEGEPAGWLADWIAAMEGLPDQSAEEQIRTVAAQLPQASPSWPPEELARLAASQIRFDLGVISRFRDPSYRMATPKGMSEIGCPTLLVCGNPELGGIAAADVLAEIEALRIARLRVERFDRSGHWPHVEEPDRFDSVVGRFLEQHA
jgi:pimeloyl-ACP methyl ester carboxylesterase